MVIDNFKLIEDLINFDDSGDSFYYLQIIQRKKDGNNNINNHRVIKFYCIHSKKGLDELKEEIITLCEVFNARAYFGLNKRSFKRIAFETLKEVGTLIYEEQYKKVYKAYNSCVGSYFTGDKLWIIDIDDSNNTEEFIGRIIEEIRKCDSGWEDPIITTVPTVNGVHIITRPFNTNQLLPFSSKYNIDIHKNNPTLLYYKQK